jgi:adenosine/AMP kinase
MEIFSIKVKIPELANIVIGQTHFIKSVEDIFEAMVTSVPKAQFGIAFSEASGPCLIRHDGNDQALEKIAVDICGELGAGHIFVLLMRDAYPINVLNRLKEVQEVCNIFCATANPLEVIIAQTELGRGILGIIDGNSPKGVEDEKASKDRIDFLRKIGYKR